jgi:hypothetical protein
MLRLRGLRCDTQARLIWARQPSGAWGLAGDGLMVATIANLPMRSFLPHPGLIDLVPAKRTSQKIKRNR